MGADPAAAIFVGYRGNNAAAAENPASGAWNPGSPRGPAREQHAEEPAYVHLYRTGPVAGDRSGRGGITTGLGRLR
jgi:hypothetical protein